jgi:hypothetical protein
VIEELYRTESADFAADSLQKQQKRLWAQGCHLHAPRLPASAECGVIEA